MRTTVYAASTCAPWQQVTSAEEQRMQERQEKHAAVQKSGDPRGWLESLGQCSDVSQVLLQASSVASVAHVAAEGRGRVLFR